MADHYKVLGVTKDASKDQIKEAFRKLALQFHPDKHAQSSKSARDDADFRFKQVSEAYEILIDDRKRAAYNLSRGNFNSQGNPNYNYHHRGGSYHPPSPPPPPSSLQSSRFRSNLDAVFQYMATRGFLLNIVFAGVVLGGTLAINTSGESIWKIQNPGKSFEEAMMSIEKNRGRKDQD